MGTSTTTVRERLEAALRDVAAEQGVSVAEIGGFADRGYKAWLKARGQDPSGDRVHMVAYLALNEIVVSMTRD